MERVERAVLSKRFRDQEARGRVGIRPGRGPFLIAQTRLPTCCHEAPQTEHDASCRRGCTRIRMEIE